jgi:hypothetical protein
MRTRLYDPLLLGSFGAPSGLGNVWRSAPLKGYQFGDLGRHICHRLFCAVQAASRAQ